MVNARVNAHHFCETLPNARDASSPKAFTGCTRHKDGETIAPSRGKKIAGIPIRTPGEEFFLLPLFSRRPAAVRTF
jgi:hypothetical protein